MHSTHAIALPEPLKRPPNGPPGGAPGSAGAPDLEGPPTLRVPVAPASSGPLPQLPVPAVTPPPLGELDFSCSVWSATAEDEASRAHRNPRVGDTLLGFKLVGELGRGAFARVFLAEQEVLASRPVALKVTLRPTREAQRLARLQHTNVVPVYSVHDDGPVQVICMPFLGRTTIADLIRAYRVDHPTRHTGRRSTSARGGRTTALDSKGRGSKTADSKGGADPTRAPIWTWDAEEPPPIVGDPRAVLQLLAQLADGLGHAHARGILHLDLKPANVLLADTGEPMLLDFNLSFDATQPDRELVGGTMPYMAIEQLLDMRNRGRGAIDARTDLYALGVMAYEMLTGAVPFGAAVRECRDIDAQVAARRHGPPPLRARNPFVTPAVEAVVLKLLAPAPGDRYQSADELRTDIDRHLNDLPLKYARERSARERFGKWRRRHPRAPYRAAVACVVALAVACGALAYRSSEAKATVEAENRAKEARDGLDALRLDLVLPDDPKARTRGVERATELLAEYGLPGAADWQERPAVRRLPEAQRAALAADLGELLVLLARARWQEAEHRPDAERRDRAGDVWKLLGAARVCLPADRAPAALDRLAAAVAPAAGESFDPPAAPAAGRERGACDLFLDAALALNEGRYAGAADLLDRAVAARPDHAAAQFCLAFCRQQAGSWHRALERYDIARVRLPRDPRPAYQRGLIFALLRQSAKAEAEFTKALALEPTHRDALRSRALVRWRLGTEDKLAGAEADLTAALGHGAQPLWVHLIRARVRAARGDRAGAATDFAAAKDLPPATGADFLVRGWTRIDSDPNGARADFERSLEFDPRALVGLQNLAHVLADKLKDNEGALAVATRVAELFPEYGPALSGRAVLLARLGRRAEAHKEIEKARQLSDDPEITYQAGCVFALTSSAHPPDLAKALALLRQAYHDGYTAGCATAKDPDLDSIRDNEEFREIQRAAKTLAK